MADEEESSNGGARKVDAGVRTPTWRETPGVIEVKLDVTDPASVAAAAARCGDTTLLINNAGIVRLNADSLDPLMTDLSREIFETNYYGAIRACQIFAPVIAGNGGGAGINVLSDAVWLSRPPLAAYRSEEHTSDLQSLMRISYAVFFLTKQKEQHTSNTH